MAGERARYKSLLHHKARSSSFWYTGHASLASHHVARLELCTAQSARQYHVLSTLPSYVACSWHQASAQYCMAFLKPNCVYTHDVNTHGLNFTWWCKAAQHTMLQLE